jgi:FkbM family methyltransferase
VILDLGCNIGLTVVDLKSLYPGATIIGVEMDRANFELCRQNTASLDDCRIFHAAIWKANGTIQYAGINEQSYAIDAPGGTANTVQSITMDDLIAQNHITNIDYIKMDIEGAEKAILLETEPTAWLEKTNCLSIEIHDTAGSKSAELFNEVRNKLQKEGFRVRKDSNHWCTLIATKK